MRLRFVGIGVFLLAVSACSGGGGSPGPAGPAPPTSTPTPVPTPPPARPAKSGDSFAYAGTFVRAFVRNPEPGRVVPSPVQTDAQTFTSAVTQAVTVTTGATFGATTDLTDFKTIETDVQSSPAKTSTVTTEAFARFPTAPNGPIRAVATVATTSDGARFVTTFGGDNGLVDVLPEVQGPIAPANSASLMTIETDADGTTTTRQTNADGSYVETAKYPDGTSATATEAADGTGTFSLPLFGYGTSPATPMTANTQLIVGAIVPGVSPNPTYIPIRIVYPAGLIDPKSAVTVDRKIGDWYPSVAPLPPVLSSESYVDTGARPIPAACNVAPSLAVTGNALVQSIAKVDVLFGEIETLTTTAYVASAGVACTQVVDSVAQYYDYTGQTYRSLATYATPLQTTTSTETLGLTGETVLGALHTTDAVRGGTVAVGDLGVLQSFTASLERRRLERHAAARRAFRFAGAR